MKDKPKIILTGACGFVGSNIAKRLIYSGYQIINIDNCIFGNADNLMLVPVKRIDFKDISDIELDQADLLIHCATSNIIYAIDKPIETFQNNATNTIRLFQRFHGRIIYTSTASVYGQADMLPTPEDAQIRTNNAYDQSKYIAELFLQQRGNYTTLRLSNVYGPNQRPDNPFCGVVGRLIDSISHYKQVKINGEGTQTRDYTYVDDVVDSVLKAIEMPVLNTEINIATCKETNILQLVEIISKIMGKTAFEQHIQNRKIDGITKRCLNIEKADQLLGWKPRINIHEGIKKTIEWHQAQSLK